MERVMSALEAARHNRHWSLEEAGSCFGVDRATFLRWERGKSKPRAANLRQLCQEFGMTAWELGFDDGGAEEDIQVETGPEIRAYIAASLKMRLSVLTAAPLISFPALHDRMTEIIQEVTQNMDKMTAQMTRREALRDLVITPFIAMNLTPFSQGKSKVDTMRTEDILAQCAAGIASCGELSLSNDASDLGLSYEGLSVYFSLLTKIVKDSSQYRKEAVRLAAQCASAKTLLTWHLRGSGEAVQCAQDAVEYAKASEDVLLQLSAFKYQAWAYYYDASQGSKDLYSMHEALLLLKKHEKEVPLSLQGNIYSTLAHMQARHGQTCTAALHRAEKAMLAQESMSLTDPPIPTLLLNLSSTLYHQHDYGEGLKFAWQVIDEKSLRAKMPMSERTRVEAINAMTMALLKSPEKDQERILFAWEIGMQGARILKSERRFNEALLNYHVMEAIWPKEQKIKDLCTLTVHW